MPRDSNGVYTLLNNSNYPALPGVTIASSAHNASQEDIEAALNAIPSDALDTGAGWDDSLDAAVASKLIRQVATYAALTALTTNTGLVDSGIYYVRGRASNGDGGEGFFRYNSGSTATVDGGTILAIDGGGAGRFFRTAYNGALYPEFFGTSADWGAAFTAMFAALPANQGRCALRNGQSYTLSTAVTCTGKNFFQFDISGAKITQAYTGGPQFTFGTGLSLTQDIAIIGEAAWIDCGTTANQPLFYTRGVRGFRTLGFRVINCYQFHQWGNPADTFHSYNWTNNAEVSMRGNSSGGHSDFCQADGSLGGYYAVADKASGDSVNVSGEQVGFRLTSAQQSSFSAANRRFDSMNLVGSQFDSFDWFLKHLDARLVNVDVGDTCRWDQMVGGGIYGEVTSGATQGGGEKWSLRATCGTATAGTNSRIVQIVQGNISTIGFTNLNIGGAANDCRASPVDISQTGVGVVSNITIDGVEIFNYQPSDATQPAIKLVGAISGFVDNITLNGKAGATFQASYTVYNDTPTTSAMRIGRNIGGVGHTNTGIVYDPNIGDLSIGRFCELNTDGSPRMGYPVTFYQTDFATSQTNVAMTLADNVGNAFFVRRRCRIVGMTTRLNAAVAAGSLTVGGATGASINTNLDIVMTSGQGGIVDYLAGSAALAAGDPVYARYTSDGSLTANIDGYATLFIQEM